MDTYEIDYGNWGNAFLFYNYVAKFHPELVTGLDIESYIDVRNYIRQHHPEVYTQWLLTK